MRLADLFRRHSDAAPSFPIAFEGRRFLIPARPGPDYLLDWMRRKRSFYELDLLMALRETVPPGGVALDCGANIGNHALFFAAVMGLRTYAFEPVEANLALLRRLVELNGLAASIEIVPIALSDVGGELWLSAPDPINPGTFRVAAGGQGQKVEALCLDDALGRLGVDPSAVSLVKIDVEGHEEQLLRGGQGLLAGGDPVLAVETFDVGTFDRICGSLGALGYGPAAVHCATPTVLFRRGADAEAAGAVRARVVEYEIAARGKR